MTEKKKSKLEQFKEASNALRGTISEEVAKATTHLSESDAQLLKFHGAYQQDDRDRRKELKAKGEEKAFSFMVRMKIPGGVVNRKAILTALDLCDRYGNGTVRITVRQGLQLHGVLKGDLKPTIAAINDTLLTTLGACGDVVRNVMCCPAPIDDAEHRAALDAAERLAEHFTPRTGAYHEIWLDGEKLGRGLKPPVHSEEDRGLQPPVLEEPDPIYGAAYLPRKFKMGVAVPGDNCIDLYADDFGVIPQMAEGAVVGYNLLVGGGLGMTTGNEATFPRLADPFGFVAPDRLVATAEAVIGVFRDSGDRVNRRHARLKYLIHDKGLAWFFGEVEQRLGESLEPFRRVAWDSADDHFGWHPQAGGAWFLGLFVENGRIIDRDRLRLKTVLRRIATEFDVSFRLTAKQNILICDVSEPEKETIAALLAEHGVRREDELTPVRREAMACPALPTCGLALAEAERALPGILDALETEMDALGLGQEAVSIRMTGCPNGCARPTLAELAFIGRTPGVYDLYAGSDRHGTRLNAVMLEKVPEAELVATVTCLLRFYADSRAEHEGFGDFCHRQGRDALCQAVGG